MQNAPFVSCRNDLNGSQLGTRPVFSVGALSQMEKETATRPTRQERSVNAVGRLQRVLKLQRFPQPTQSKRSQVSLHKLEALKAFLCLLPVLLYRHQLVLRFLPPS